MTEERSVLLAEDHAVLRQALRARLDGEPDLQVVAEVATTDDAIAGSVRLAPDVVVMDVVLPGVSCFEAARTIQARSPGTRVMFLSGYRNDHYIEQALRVGAWGYLLKSEPLESVVTAVRTVASGRRCFSPEVQARIVPGTGLPGKTSEAGSRLTTLSARETEVLQYIGHGLAMKEIARVMSLSQHTVHRHTTRIMQKLDIHDRVQLARYAIAEGLAQL